MKFSRYDLKQIDNDTIDKLEQDHLRTLSKRLLSDLKEAIDRLNQNSNNSSRPSSSMSPWEQIVTDLDESDLTDNYDDNEDSSLENREENNNKEQSDEQPGENGTPVQIAAGNQTTGPLKGKGLDNKPEKKKPGKQKGAPGYGRTWNPPITEDAIYCYPSHCCICDQELDQDNSVIYTGYNQIDIELGISAKPGMVVTNTPYFLYEIICACGHKNRYNPKSTPLADEIWKGTSLSEWRLIGPKLVAFIVHLKMEFRLTIRKIRDVLRYFGISISTGTIQKCYEESGAIVAPLEESLTQALLDEALLHADETVWLEKSKTLWLWVFSAACVVYYCVGSRTKKFLQQILKTSFRGWLMTDGYGAYRHYEKRLRCWAHLLRKARGLAESTDLVAIIFGRLVLKFLNSCMDKVYFWREQSLPEKKTEILIQALQPLIDEFKRACEKYGEDEIAHDKTRSLAREFLNDWQAIFRILEHPYLPLTNNKAEQKLRPWVLLRKICYGSRSAKGTKVFTLLASIIDTCRLRRVNSMHFLAEAILSARKCMPLPMIPVAII